MGKRRVKVRDKHSTGNWLARRWSLMTPAAKKKTITLFIAGLFSLCAVLVASVVAFKFLGTSDFFQISSLRINGNHEVRKAEIVKLSGLDIYSNLLTVKTELIRKNIESHAWVERAIVKKKWPNVLTVDVRERKPLAIINTDKGIYYIDKTAAVFTKVEGGFDLDYPVFSGMEDMVRVSAAGEVEVVDSQKINEALGLTGFASSGSSSFPRQNISQINYDKENKLVLFLTDRPFPIFLGDDASRQKFERLKKVLYWLYKKKEFANIDYIRLDYLENKVLVGKNNS
nr:FtsQ-type POTRA domain-containing protein [Desulfobulbaceae bacterium]